MRTMTPAIIFVACLGKSSSIPFIIGCNHNRSPDLLGVAHSTKRDPSFLIRTEFRSCLRVFLAVSVFLSSAYQVICFSFLGNNLVKVIILGFLHACWHANYSLGDFCVGQLISRLDFANHVSGPLKITENISISFLQFYFSIFNIS